MRRTLAILAVAGTAAAFATAAGAHVIVRPTVLPGERLVTLFVRVPNERPGEAGRSSATNKVDVKFPAGISSVHYQPRAGWKVTVLRRPAQDGKNTEVDRVIFTATQPGARIGPGQMVEFPLAAAIPGRPDGFVAEFRALQYYSSGEIVRWIGEPSSATPASQVLIGGRDEQAKDFPGGVVSAKKGLSGYKEPLLGAAALIPLVFLAGLYFGRRSRSRVA